MNIKITASCIYLVLAGDGLIYRFYEFGGGVLMIKFTGCKMLSL